MWLLSPNHPHFVICTSEIQHKPSNNHPQSTTCSFPPSAIFSCSKSSGRGGDGDGDVEVDADYLIKKRKRDVRGFASWPDQLFKPDSLEMEPIQDSDHFDQILESANQLSQPILVDWMAEWCRKCIYLKPKLEKLAAEYDSKIKFYCVDVNNVPQALVKRGNISKMPTIQIWRDGEMKAEVIGGHKAWLVVEEVKQMIQQFV